ncbi:MAG: hypothetical protein R3F30_00820 [Planctomycetota bacterium]
MRPLIAIPALLCCLPLGGCAVTDYLEHRALDLADCVKLTAGVGPGLTLEARATDWLSPGVGYASRTIQVGWEDREINGVWDECVVIHMPRAAVEYFGGSYEERETGILSTGERLTRIGISTVLLANERWTRTDDKGEVRLEYFSLFNLGSVPEEARVPDPAIWFLEDYQRPVLREKTVWQKGWFEVGATAGIVSLRAGVNLFEVVDFAFGLLGIDPACDDKRLYRLPEAAVPALPLR